MEIWCCVALSCEMTEVGWGWEAIDYSDDEILKLG